MINVLLLLCVTFSGTLGLTLLQRIDKLEERLLLLGNRETTDLVQKVKNEVLKEFKDFEMKYEEEKNQLTAKIEALEMVSKNREDDVALKLKELEQGTEIISKRLSEVEVATAKSLDELSSKLEKDKVSFLTMENYILREIQQVQKNTFEAFGKINNVRDNVTSALERERSKIEILQVKLDETREITNSFSTSQRHCQDVIRQNISLSAEKLKLYINESLTLGFDSMQSNLSAKMRSLESSFLQFEKDYANATYVSQLNESLQNLDKTMKAELHSIQAELDQRVKQLEERNVEGPRYFPEAVCSPPCRNGGTCEKGNTCICSPLFIGDRCEDAVCSPPCRNGGACLGGNTCACASLFSGERCQNDHSLCGRTFGDGSNFPWMAALYVLEGSVPQPPGERREGSSKSVRDDSEIRCAGTIIHQRFILTSANCLYNFFGSLREGKDVAVKLGLTNISDATHLQEFNPRKIHVHPLYKPMSSFDYNIALLELEKPIHYNSFISPVCLPSKETDGNSRFYTPGSEVKATGWGHQGIVQKLGTPGTNFSQVLKEISLLILPRGVCTESLKDDNVESFFTPRMFCASERGSYVICRGDQGGPAMQSHVNKEGDRIWTQVGIINWSLGCGLPREFSFFSELQQLMTWVDSIIKAATEI